MQALAALKTTASHYYSTSMNVLHFWLQLLALVTCCVALADQVAGKDTTTSISPTIAWVTVTTNGQVNTVKTTFKQTFMSTYSEPTSSVAAGTIGVGSQSNDVGHVRTYSQTTISNAGAVVQSPFSGVVLLVLGWMF